LKVAKKYIKTIVLAFLQEESRKRESQEGRKGEGWEGEQEKGREKDREKGR